MGQSSLFAAIVRVRPLGLTDQRYRPTSPVEHASPPPVVSSWNWPSPTPDATEFRKWSWFRFD
jgi:hypothetical protein